MDSGSGRARSTAVRAPDEAQRALQEVPTTPCLARFGDLAALPEDAYTAQLDEEAYLEREYARASREAGRKSGWRNGVPQCQACRRIMAAYNAPCPGCGGYSQGGIGSRGRGGR